MLVFVSGTFALFWIAYRHNYYFVQRNKIDTHGLLFNNALSQLFAGLYVLEIALIGLFFLVRDTHNGASCKSQAIVMIVLLILTAIFHFVMEQHLRPLYEFLPVTLEDSAVDAERERSLIHHENDSSPSIDLGSGDGTAASGLAANGTSARDINNSNEKGKSHFQTKSVSATAAYARKALSRVTKETAARVAEIHNHIPEDAAMARSHRRAVADQLAAALAGYPDELTDLDREELDAELKAAFQDPVTREPAPVIWIPQDPAGISDLIVKQSLKYGHNLQYSNAGAYLTKKNKCEVTQPAPDVRPDWLLDWML